MSKYGNLHAPIPDMNKEIAALKDLLAKGEIGEAEYQDKFKHCIRLRNAYIVGTNGGYTPKRKKNVRQTIVEQRDRVTAAKSVEISQTIDGEALLKSGGLEDESPPPPDPSG